MTSHDSKLYSDRSVDSATSNAEFDCKTESIHSHPDDILETTSTVDQDIADALLVAQSSRWSDASLWESIHTECMDILRSYEPFSTADDTVRVLRSFVVNLCPDGQAILISEIRKHHQPGENLVLLRNHLVDAILRPMRKISSKKPIGKPVDDDAKATIEESLADGFMTPSKREHNLRKTILTRDDWRCVATGMQDKDAIKRYLDKEDRPAIEHGTSRTDCAHIIPFQLAEFKESDFIATNNKATIWYALKRYFPRLGDKIGPQTINQPSNLISLTYNCHNQFNSHKFSFRECSDDNVYILDKHDRDESFQSMPQMVSFKSKNKLPLPDPAFLDLHHRVCLIMSEFSKHDLKYSILERGKKFLRKGTKRKYPAGSNSHDDAGGH